MQEYHGAQPAITVVIPVYRVEAYLRECVESVLAQSMTDYEIVLVDDGSPDGSPAICDEYAAQYPGPHLPAIRVVHKANAGLGMARNSGMDAARGRYIFFLDSDDTIRPDTLTRLYEIACESGADAVHGRLCRFVTPGKYSHEVVGGEPMVIEGDALRHAALCSYASFPGDEPYTLEGSSCCCLYRLDFLRRHGIRFRSEREYISEDYIFNYEVALHAQQCVQLPDTFYRYRVNPESLTQTPKADVMERVVAYCESIEQMMLTDGYGPLSQRYAYGYAASRLRAQLKYLMLSPLTTAEKVARALRWRDMPYFSRMEREYDFRLMSRLHRLSYQLFMKGNMRSLMAIIRAQSLLRKMKGHIGD